jgi:hypothetical protein
MELRNNTSPDRQAVSIELRMDGAKLGHIVLEAAELDDYIHKLADHRAELIDAVSSQLDPGSRLDVIVGPAWGVPHPPHELGKVLALRHPGFGWLSFLLPAEDARALAKALLLGLPDETPKAP